MQTRLRNAKWAFYPETTLPTVGGQNPKFLLLKPPHGAWSIQEASENQLQLRTHRQLHPPRCTTGHLSGGPSVEVVIHAEVCAGASLVGKGPSSGVPWIHVPGPEEHQSGWAGYAAVTSDLESQ